MNDQEIAGEKVIEATNELNFKKKDKVTNIELEQMMKSFIVDTRLALQLRSQNSDLKRKIDALIQNNEKFAELVAMLEQKNKRTHVREEEKMIYSYQDGAMVKNDELDKRKLMLHKKKLTLNEINTQLNEILGLLEQKKKKT